MRGKPRGLYGVGWAGRGSCAGVMCPLPPSTPHPRKGGLSGSPPRVAARARAWGAALMCWRCPDVLSRFGGLATTRVRVAPACYHTQTLGGDAIRQDAPHRGHPTILSGRGPRAPVSAWSVAVGRGRMNNSRKPLAAGHPTKKSFAVTPVTSFCDQLGGQAP